MSKLVSHLKSIYQQHETVNIVKLPLLLKIYALCLKPVCLCTNCDRKLVYAAVLFSDCYNFPPI